MIVAPSLPGSKWLSIIYFSPALRLTDFEVSAALQHTLCFLELQYTAGTVGRQTDSDKTRCPSGESLGPW
jgi:hypothetical protein